MVHEPYKRPFAVIAFWMLIGMSVLSNHLDAAPPTILFQGARLIVDARRPPIENAAFLIENGHVAKIGKKGTVQAPAAAMRVDLTGKTVMPALIDSHVHLGYQKDLSYAAENFTRGNLVDQLDRYSYSGIAAVLSLGTDLGDLPFQIRAEQDA